MKTALISGILGQDGSYLAESLLKKGYKVAGIYRRSSSPNFWRIPFYRKLDLYEGDITDMSSLLYIVGKTQPDEIYNLAAQSHVGTSFTQPQYTINVDLLGCLNFLEIIRQLKLKTRFYQASTSEMYGSNYSTAPYNPDTKEVYKKGYPMSYNKFSMILDYPYQDEDTPFSPNSPYAIAKLAAHNAVKVYREAYGLHASCGILFNHESPRRGEEFVTRKITKYIGGLTLYRWDKTSPLKSWYNNPEKLKLGNINASRDWGHAIDYVRGMWLMLQQDKPDDYVLATGQTHNVAEFLDESFSYVSHGGLDWKDFVEIDKNLFRPSEVEYLRGDATKAKEKLGWTPEVDFKTLVHEMVDADGRK